MSKRYIDQGSGFRSEEPAPVAAIVGGVGAFVGLVAIVAILGSEGKPPQPAAYRTGEACSAAQPFRDCVALCDFTYPPYANGDTSAAYTCSRGAAARFKQ